MTFLRWVTLMGVIIATEHWAINTWINRLEQRYWETR